MGSSQATAKAFAPYVTCPARTKGSDKFHEFNESYLLLRLSGLVL